MYNVFIVEDEDRVRRSIRNNVKWKDAKCECVGEAPNGEVALPLLKELKPDILITDIKMPFMDGLVLIKEVRNIFPWMKILILSGYDEFEFVQKAMSFGVSEYILKPINSRGLIELLQKIVKKIEEEQSKINDIETLKNELEESLPLLQERFLNELIIGSNLSDNFLQRTEFLGINIFGAFFVVELIEITLEETIPVKNLSIENVKIYKNIFRTVGENQNVIIFTKT